MRADQVEVGLIQPMPGARRARAEEGVQEPESIWGEDATQLFQIFFSALFRNPMETAEVQRQVKWAGDPGEVRCIPNAYICVQSAGFQLLSGKLDRARSKVHARYSPACLGQRHNVCTRAAANVDRAT